MGNIHLALPAAGVPALGTVANLKVVGALQRGDLAREVSERQSDYCNRYWGLPQVRAELRSQFSCGDCGTIWVQGFELETFAHVL